MAIPLPRCIGEDDLHAAVGGVVRPLPFFSIAVPNIVGILLLKLERECSSYISLVHNRSQYNTVGSRHCLSHLVWLHLLGELGSPEGKCLLQCQSDALEEQAVLQPAKVAHMVISPQRFVQVPHTGWVGLPGKLRGKSYSTTYTTCGLQCEIEC